MKGFSIQPAPQGIYPAVCHLGFTYIPLTEEGLARLRAAASPGELRRAVLEVVGVSTYLKEQIEQLWTAESAEQLRRTLAQHFPQ
jgi:hypothetical protein